MYYKVTCEGQEGQSQLNQVHNFTAGVMCSEHTDIHRGAMVSKQTSVKDGIHWHTIHVSAMY